MNGSAEKSYRKFLWVLVLLGVGLDQTSKYSVFKRLYPVVVDSQGNPIPIRHDLVPGYFRFVAQYTKDEVPSGVLADLRNISGPTLPYVNEGALFGLGQEYKTLANSVFTIISLIAAGTMVFWTSRASTARDPGLCIALGLILAGTLGNLYDRLVFSGVRDFLEFYWFRFPVFNVADCCLVCGAFLLLGQAFLHRPAAAIEPTPEMALSAAANGGAK